MSGIARFVVAALVSTTLFGAGTIAGAQSSNTGAQQSTKTARIGFLSPVARATRTRTTEAFRQGLADLGYVDGKNIAIEARF